VTERLAVSAERQRLSAAKSGRPATPRKFPGIGHLSKNLVTAMREDRMAQRRFKAICIIFVVAVTCLGANCAVAQDAAEGKVLRVAVKPIAPFVF